MANMSDLDATDRHLLAELQRDARQTNADLARAVGLAVSSVNERIRKLTERGVITGTHAHVTPEALGLDLFCFVFVGVADPQAEQAFLAHIAPEPHVLECHHITGSWNHILKVRVRNTRELETFFARVIKVVPGVNRTETMIVLSSTKDTTALPTSDPAWR
jgi:Lrp/AsnC family transcriptional regulator, leucine-responsive regulatory protein